MEYEAVIGLETHVQLKTQSKMWCGCANAFGSDPNTNVCPICLGMLGVLPVPNAEAIRLTVLTGYLLNCEIPRFAKFDRKNYFYPDSAKNYQVTQYDKPSTANGWLEFEFDGPGSVDGMARVQITRAHLEEDVGKNSHFDRFSGVDFNRAGVPLLEIVSEPELNGPEMAYAYLRALTDVLFRGGISEYEIPRQIAALQRGETLRQETRRWDDLAGITETMRSKEDAHDYRYFPEPDLMPLVPTDDWLALVKSQVVELPLARKKRFIREYGLPDGDAEIFRDNVPLATFFERAIQGATQPKAIANWVINNLQARVSGSGLAVEEVLIQPAQVRDLVGLVESGAINSKIAQDVFAEMFTTGDAPQVIVERNGWSQMSDVGALEALCDQAIVANPGSAADFRAGKVAALNALKGQVMKLSKGKANPALAGEILERKLRA